MSSFFYKKLHLVHLIYAPPISLSLISNICPEVFKTQAKELDVSEFEM